MNGDADNLDRVMVDIKASSSHRVDASRRTRLLRFLAPWTALRGGYEIWVGSTLFSPEVLSDDALEDLAARVVADFWATRRRIRLNYLAALLGAEAASLRRAA